MGIFGGGGNSTPTRLFETRVNQAVYGLPYPVVMGTAQVQQSILWIDEFDATQQKAGGKGGSGGGKGGGGKSGGTFYTYTADVVAALCAGPILGIADVWSGQSWLGSPTAAETYTISGSGIYTPTNAASLQNDLGVSVENSYSGSYNDYGSPGSVTLSGTSRAPMYRVSYGSTLNTGQYSIDPATGNYHFNTSADSSRVVHLSYSFLLTNINQQENDVVPSGGTINVGGSLQFLSDLGVRDTITNAAFTRVSGTPTAIGTYQVTGSGPATYHFYTPGGAGDTGRQITMTFQIKDPNAVGQGQSTQLNVQLNNGGTGQTPFSFLTASFPGAAFSFPGVAVVLYQPMGLGASAEIQQNKFEVITPDAYGGGVEDCNPITCITNVLTNNKWGLGVGPIPFPTSVIDNGSSGTWGGAPSTPGSHVVSSQAWNWCSANNYFISPVIDTQDTAASLMSKWLEAGMLAAFYSEGLLKLVPYGDTTTVGNGCTWTAPSNFIVALDDSCFIAKTDEDPVKILRVAAHDAWNVVQVQWDNRFNQYSPEITQESDQGLINRWGERREDPQNWDFIHTITAATFAANMRLKHGSYIRNTYEFDLPYTYSYLEPMDIVTISTTSVWAQGLNNQNLGVVNLPVRITKIVDDPAIGLQITAEDYPFGAHQPDLYNKQISNGDVVANAFADPGAAEVVMFEAYNGLTGFAGDQIWIGACGTSKNYGFTNIWCSSDGGTTYKNVGTIRNPARMGTLHSTFASGSDPDTTNSLVVDLVENCAALEAGTSGDADNGNTMCFVDGEIISYSALTYTGQNQITMGTYIRRGQKGSTIASHSSSTLFMRLDDAVYKYTYDPTWRGKTLKFKFQAVNSFGNNAQPLSSLTAVSFTLPGTSKGTVDASSGIILGPALPNSTPLNPQGSIAGAGVNTFSYSSTTTTIKVTWTSFPCYNPDGTSFTIPANAGGTTFSGLTSGTTYYVGTYVNISTGLCVAVLSDVSSGTAPFSVQYITQTLNGDGKIGVNWNIAMATTATGTGGGSGGGGGAGGCFTPNSRLLDLTPISKVRVGDLVWVELEDRALVQRPVGSVLVYEYDGVLHNVANGTWVTPNHRFKQQDGSWKRADELFPKTMHYKGTVHNLHIDTQDDSERNYVLWNRAVAHNYKLL
jgi:hypothetical protein